MFDVSDNSAIGFYAQQGRWSKALNIAFWVLQSLTDCGSIPDREHD
jgi:hypothetical protein